MRQSPRFSTDASLKLSNCSAPNLAGTVTGLLAAPDELDDEELELDDEELELDDELELEDELELDDEELELEDELELDEEPALSGVVCKESLPPPQPIIKMLASSIVGY